VDVNIAFLNGVVEEEIYIEYHEGFDEFYKETHVCRLRRSIYGLKQAPHAWYIHIDSYLNGLGFTKSEVDANVYYIVVDGKFLILVLYVDELILMGMRI